MIADARFSPNFPRKITHRHVRIIRVVQHCSAISATAKLLQREVANIHRDTDTQTDRHTDRKTNEDAR